MTRRHDRGSICNRLVVGAAALAVATLTSLLVPGLARAAHAADDCSGKTYTWTGQGDGRTWSDSQNWSPSDGTPGDGDIAEIDASTVGGEVFLDDPHSLCNLSVTSAPDDAVFLHAEAGFTVSHDFLLDGATSSDRVHWDGPVTVGGTTTLHGYVAYDANGATFPDGISTLTTSTLMVADNADVLLTGGMTNLHSTTSADLGTSRIWSNGSSDSDDIAQLQVDGSLALGGDVDLSADLDLGAGASVDLSGHTLDVNSHSYSWWTGATIASTGAAGDVQFRDGTWLLLDGTDTIDDGVTLHFHDDSRMSDSANYPGIAPNHASGHAGTLAGTGSVEWTSGHLVGHVTLGSHITTTLDGTSGEWRIEQDPGTVLTNNGRLVVASGDLDVPADPGQIVNNGRLVLWAGVIVTGSAGQTDIVNGPTGTVLVAPSALRPTAKTAVIQAALVNHGTIDVPRNFALEFDGARVNALDGGGVLTGGGTLDVTDQTTVLASGTTTITGGSTLLYDGYHSFIEGGTVTPQGRWTSSATFTTPPGKSGTVAWKQGQIDGHLHFAGALAVHVTDPGDGAYRYVGGTTDYDQTQVTFGSPTTISNAEVDIHNNAAVLVAGPLALTGKAPVLGNGYGDPARGAIIHVLHGGSVTVPVGTRTAHTAATMDFPVVNSGTVDVGAHSTLTLPTSFRQVAGTLRGGGRAVGNVIVAGGLVRPSVAGGSPRVLTIQGNYQQGRHAELALFLQGTRASRHDRLVITGHAGLAGSVALLLAQHFRPSVGASFTGISVGSRTGKFGTVRSSRVPSHTHWSQRPYATSVGFKLVR